MKAAVFGGPGKLELKEVPTPEAGPGEIRLRTGSNTVCGTDLRILRGEKSKGIDRGVVLGHEIAGYVDQIGEGVTGFEIGDLVSIEPTIPCLSCEYCKTGHEQLCLHGKIFGYAVNGGLAEYVLIPKEALDAGVAFVAAKHLTPQEASLAEPLGCVINGARNYKVQPGDTVLVIGAGPIGLLHVQMALLEGASQVIMSEPSESRRATAAELGATHCVDPTKEDLQQYVYGLTNGLGADVVIVCIGVPTLVNQAMSCARKRGRVSLFAGFPKGGSAEFDPNLVHYGELEVVGASNASRDAHELALRLIGEGKINVKALHTDTFPLSKVVEAIEYVSSGDGIKVSVVPD